MSHQALSPDTEVVLLLCGHFGGERREPFPPLSAHDYDELARRLMSRGLRPADLLSGARREQVQDVGEAALARERLDFLLGRGTAMALALERWSRGGLWVMSRGDPAFPRALRRRLRHATAPLLYGAGSKELLDREGLAIVGSTEVTDAALAFTRDVAAQCARDGIAVVTGGARGVDVAAMQSAADAGGCVIGVLANDLLKASLGRQHRLGLQEGRLVLVSPFHPQAGHNAGNALDCNKYIYALSERALVIDSALGSGDTWAGAQEDLSHGWVPLHVRTPGDGAGNAALVQQGGIPFTWTPGGGVALQAYFEEAAPASGRVAVYSQRPPVPSPGQPDREALSTVAQEPIPGEVFGPAAVQRAPVSLDMYLDFLARLDLLLSGGPMSEEQIAERLGLETGQLRVWLKQASDAGVIDRLDNPARYSIDQQAPLPG